MMCTVLDCVQFSRVPCCAKCWYGRTQVCNYTAAARIHSVLFLYRRVCENSSTTIAVGITVTVNNVDTALRGSRTHEHMYCA